MRDIEEQLRISVYQAMIKGIQEYQSGKLNIYMNGKSESELFKEHVTEVVKNVRSLCQQEAGNYLLDKIKEAADKGEALQVVHLSSAWRNINVY